MPKISTRQRLFRRILMRGLNQPNWPTRLPSLGGWHVTEACGIRGPEAGGLPHTCCRYLPRRRRTQRAPTLPNAGSHHYAEAEPVTVQEKLVPYSLMAGEQALAKYAWEDAVAFFDLALTAMQSEQIDEEIAAILFVHYVLKSGLLPNSLPLINEPRFALPP